MLTPHDVADRAALELAASYDARCPGHGEEAAHWLTSGDERIPLTGEDVAALKRGEPVGCRNGPRPVRPDFPDYEAYATDADVIEGERALAKCELQMSRAAALARLRGIQPLVRQARAASRPPVAPRRPPRHARGRCSAGRPGRSARRASARAGSDDDGPGEPPPPALAGRRKHLERAR